jgi:hypothetical protein
VWVPAWEHCGTRLAMMGVHTAASACDPRGGSGLAEVVPGIPGLVGPFSRATRHATLRGAAWADLTLRALDARFRSAGRNFCAGARNAVCTHSIGWRAYALDGPRWTKPCWTTNVLGLSFSQIHFKSARAVPVSVGKRVRVFASRSGLPEVSCSPARGLRDPRYVSCWAIAECPPSCSGGPICLEPAPP